MSRLQVGGLALYIPNGLQCELLEFCGSGVLGDKEHYNKIWKIRFNQHIVTDDTNNLRMQGYCPEHELLPLGDKQTQDQFKKEECEA